MYRAKAKVALKDDLEHVCIENVQACILVGNNCMGDCQADAESLYFGMFHLTLGRGCVDM